MAAQRVLIVDDVAENRQLLVDYLDGAACEPVTAASGAEALAAVAAEPPDVVLLDLDMPGINGLEVCRSIKSSPETSMVPVVIVTAYSATEDRVAALEAGADDFLTKPVDQTELVARVRSLLRVKRLTDSLLHTEQVIFALARAVEARDGFTKAHSERVAGHARRLAEAAGLSAEAVDAVGFAARLHDIGKIAVPDAVLAKVDALNPEEIEVMRSVPVVGAEICGPITYPPGLAEIIRHQKERMDGTGFPDGLAGEQIEIGARVLAICDAYDAMVAGDREARPAMAAEKARAVLTHQSGRAFDAQLVTLFLDRVQPAEG